jgi:aldehyde:ferredoxin oxidoreductase
MKDVSPYGKGFGMWLLWNALNGDNTWDDPDNELIIAGGPDCGITALSPVPANPPS